MDPIQSQFEGNPIGAGPEGQPQKPTPDHGKLPSRTLIVVLLVAILGLAGVLGLFKVLAAEQIPDLTESALSEAEARWERAGPLNYNLDLEIGGTQPGKVHVEVRGGQVTAMARDSRSPPERTWYVWSVPGQFETLERELELAEDPVHEMHAGADTRLRLRCEFDSQYGYPKVYHRFVYGGGPEVSWHVTKFESL